MPPKDPVVVRSGLGFEPIGVHHSGDDISVARVLARPPDANQIMIQVIDDDACYTLNGSLPTNARGFVLYDGADPIIIPVEANAIFTIIEVAGGGRLEYQWGGDSA